MKCPLLYGCWIARQREELPELSDCLKEECAWWNNDSFMCALLDIDVKLKVLGLILNDIKGKMPHEKQFRK